MSAKSDSRGRSSRLSRAFWICLALTIGCWAGALVVGAFYIAYGDLLFLLEFAWCVGWACATTYRTLQVHAIDRGEV